MEIVALLLLLLKSSFGQALHRTATNHMVVSDFITVKNRTIEAVKTRSMVANKTGSLVRKISRTDSRRVSNKCSPFSKKFVCRENPKPEIGRETSSFQQELGKVDLRSGNFICCKGVHNTILESSSAKNYSKTGDIIQNTGLVDGSRDYENAGQTSHKKVKYHVPGQFLSNILLVKQKDGGNCPCITLKALNKLIPKKHFKMEGFQCLKYFLKKKTIFSAR